MEFEPQLGQPTVHFQEILESLDRLSENMSAIPDEPKSDMEAIKADVAAIKAVVTQLTYKVTVVETHVRNLRVIANNKLSEITTRYKMRYRYREVCTSFLTEYLRILFVSTERGPDDFGDCESTRSS